MSKFYPPASKWLLAALVLSSFQTYAQPKITAFSPTLGPVGTMITLTGSGFDPVAANNGVFFGSTQAVVTGSTAGSLTVEAPTGITSDVISVLNRSNGLTGYTNQPFTTTFINPHGIYIPFTFYQKTAEPATGTLPSSTALGDLNGDGKPDMVVTNSTSNTISLFRNSSSGPTGAPFTTTRIDLPAGNGPYGVTIGDVNGDGKPDIVVANSASGTLSVWRNTAVSGSLNAASFDARVDYPVGSNPVFVAMADIDGDGKPELVTGCTGVSAISVLRNQTGTGALNSSSFAAHWDYTNANFEQPRAFVLSDIDGDGKKDIAVASQALRIVSVMRNTAAPGTINGASFAPPVQFLALDRSVSPSYIIAVDLDRDGKNDLAMCNSRSNSITVLRNVSSSGIINSGSLLSAGDFQIGESPQFLAAYDVDGEGRLDLAAANSVSNNVYILGNFSLPGVIQLGGDFFYRASFNVGGSCVGLAAGDLNGNGIPDMVALNASGNSVAVFTVAVPPPPSIDSIGPLSAPVGTRVVMRGNFNVNVSNNTVFFGAVKAAIIRGSANQLEVTVPAGATYQPVSVVNRASGLAGYAAVPFTPTFSNPFGSSGIPNNYYRPKTDFATPGIFTYSVAFGDMDSDGKPDMLSVNEQSGVVSVMRNTSATGTIGAGSFASRVDFATAPLPRKVTVSDWDGDGRLDILVLSPASNTISILRNTTNAAGPITAASFAAPRIDLNIGQYISSYAVADLDLDGKPDLLLTLPYSQSVAVVTNTNMSFGVTYFSLVCGEYPRAVAVSDVNGDGKQDIVVVNERSNTVSVFRNRFTGSLLSNISFAPRVDFAVGTSPVDLALSDADGDGKPEIVVANFVSSSLSVLRNTSVASDITAASFAPAVNFATGLNPYAMAVGDADGDGKPDLLTANTASNSVSVLRNTTATGSITAASFAGKVDFGAGIYPLSVALGDLDGDGIAELAAANAGSGTISVFKAGGPAPAATGAAAAEISVRVYPNPTAGEYIVQLEDLKAPTATVEVLTGSGHAVEKQVVSLDVETPRHVLKLSLRHHPAGVYYIKVTSVRGIQVTKLVVRP